MTEQKTTLSGGAWTFACYLLGTGAVLSEFQSIPGRQTIPLLILQLCVAGLLGLGVLRAASAWRSAGTRDRALLVAGLGIVAAFFGLQDTFIHPQVALLFSMAGLVIVAGAAGGDARPLRPLLFATTAMAVSRVTDGVMLWSGDLSEELVRFQAWLDVRTDADLTRLGFSFFGGHAAIFALVLAVGLVAQSQGWRRLVALVAIVAVAVGLESLASSTRRGIALPLVLATALAAVALLTVAVHRPRPAAFRGRGASMLSASIVLGAAGVHLAFDLPDRPAFDKPRVVALEGGYETSTPTLQNTAKAQRANLGFFRRWMEGFAEDVTPVKLIDAQTLDGADILFMCNLPRKLADEEMEAITTWIARGGRLWYLGDHTDIFGVMRFSNPLIERFGLRLRFDSAMPPGSNWKSVLDLGWHPATASVDPDTVRISVGATLEVFGDARPLVVARAGWSDDGDPTNPQRAFLGNWGCDRKEQQGDLILAAESRYGEGTVVAFGDTAILQETSFSMSWPLVSGVVDYLSTRVEAPSHGRMLAGLVALSSALLVLGLGWPTLTGAAFGLVLLLGFLGLIRHHGAGDWTARLRPEAVAWLDLSRGSNLRPFTSSPEQFDGFFGGLMASGFVPLIHAAPGEPPLREKDVVVLPSRARALTEAEQEGLLDHCKGGGQVIAFVTPQDAASWSSLLAQHGVAVGEEPLGNCPGAQTWGNVSVPNLLQGWPLEVRNGASPSTRENQEVLVSCFGRPVVMSITVGQGRWVWIADGDFPFDKGWMIGDRAGRPANYRFLHALLTKES